MRLVFIALIALAQPALAAPFTATEMMKLKRLADPAVSPDGKWVAYQATEVELPSGARNTDVFLVPLAGGEPRRLTSHPKSDTRPRFSPDGKRLAFLSNRDGASQVYLLELAGGEAIRATSLHGGVDAFLWIDERTLLVTSDVRPDGEGRREGRRAPPRVYSSLFVRHWDTWEDGQAHAPLRGTARRDRGARPDPRRPRRAPFHLGGPDDYDVSPDGKEVCFSRKDDALQAASTNADLFVVPVSGGRAEEDRREPRLRRSAAATAPTVRPSPSGRRCAAATSPIAGASWSTTARAAPCAPSPRPSTARWASPRGRSTRRRSISPPRTTAARRCSRFPPREAP